MAGMLAAHVLTVRAMNRATEAWSEYTCEM